MSSKKNTNKISKSNKSTLKLEDFPKWAQILFICLQPPILIINLISIYLLFMSGNEAVGATAAVVALAGDLLAFAYFYFQKIIDISNFTKRIPFTAILLVGPLAVLVVSGFGYGVIFKVIAQHEFDRAVASREFEEASQSLFAAKTLRFDVEGELSSEFLSSLENLDNDKATWIAKLYRDNGYDVTSVNYKVVQRLRDAVTNKDEQRAQILTEVLIILDPDQSSMIAQEFNDAGVIALSKDPPDRSVARIYLEMVKMIDESPSVERSRSNFERSISLYNLAQIIEDDDPQGAIQIYRKAIQVDDTNIDAYYALSSFLLIHHQQYPELLTEAVNVASDGRQHINGRYCSGSQDLSIKDTMHSSWVCFLLLTSEAGARFERGDESRLILPLLERAIMLAEQNKHFGPGYYTAEPYYYLARLNEPNPPKNILCQIIMHRNRVLARHQEWALFAENLLNGELCP